MANGALPLTVEPGSEAGDKDGDGGQRAVDPYLSGCGDAKGWEEGREEAGIVRIRGFGGGCGKCGGGLVGTGARRRWELSRAGGLVACAPISGLSVPWRRD